MQQSLLDCHSQKNHSSIKLQDEDSKRLNHTLAPFWFPRNYFVPVVWTPETIEIILFVSPLARESHEKRTVIFSVCRDGAKKKNNRNNAPSNFENYHSGPNSYCSKVGYCYSGNKSWLINWTNIVNTGTGAIFINQLIFAQLILNVQETKTIQVPIHEEQSFYSPANLLIGLSEKETEYLLSEHSK